ncbi:MAG: hypothetical protein HY064_08815 [Bacteroidetes bacterium]|nr:hypothetical protein [Bacteroidota bacterium]
MINESQIRAYATQKIKEGISKQEIYNYVVDQCKESKTIVSVLQATPSIAARKKWGWLNIILAVILGTGAILSFLSFSIGGILWTGFGLAVVLSYRVNLYVWVSIIGACGFIGVIAVMVVAMNQHPINPVPFIIAASFAGLVTFLGFFLSARLSPACEEEKVMYKTSDGKKRLKVVHKFRDI